jgi:hypothetical protein
MSRHSQLGLGGTGRGSFPHAMTTPRVIFRGFWAMMFLSVVMILIAIARRTTAHKTIPPLCKCACMIKAVVQ